MDPRARKLRLALWILALGMMLGLGWAGWQGWGLGRSYPDNTILGPPKNFCSDFTSVLRFCGLPSPYQDERAVYPPGAYLLLRPLAFGNVALALALFMGVTLDLGIALQADSLRPVLRHPARRFFIAITLTLLSYPVWFCMNRGNTEILMGLLVGGALGLMERRLFGWAAFLLAVTIVMKLYTAVLLLLLVRRRHVVQLGWGLAAAAFSLASLASFAGTLPENMALWRRNYAFYNQYYLIENGGLAGCSSGWNLVKIIFLTLAGVRDGQIPASVLGALPLLLKGYQAAYLVLMAAVCFLVLFVEREFFRRALFLLFIAATSAPSGGDYKLIFIQVALFVLILIPKQRPHDLWVVALLAAIIVPKKEIFLTYLGASDTGHNDVAISVVVNPLLLLVAAGLLTHDAWRTRISGWGWRRLAGLVSLLGPRAVSSWQRILSLPGKERS